MVPEIWNETDRIFCHFGPFFPLTTQKIRILKNQNFKKVKKKCLELSFYTCVPKSMIT